MIALLAAMQSEIADIQKRAIIEDSSRIEGYHISRGSLSDKKVILAVTGIGRRKAQRAAEIVLGRYDVESAISLGTAGALVPELKVGDIVLCSTVYNGRLKTLDGYISDKRLLQVAASLRYPKFKTVTGNSVTVALPACTLAEKQALSQAFAAQVVEMESYWIGKVAQKKTMPFLTIRAVSDGLDDQLPDFARFVDNQGRWHKRKAAAYFLTKPQEAFRLLRLRHNAGLAGLNLSIFIEDLLARL